MYKSECTSFANFLRRLSYNIHAAPFTLEELVSTYKMSSPVYSHTFSSLSTGAVPAISLNILLIGTMLPASRTGVFFNASL